VDLVNTYSFTKKLNAEFQARIKRAQNNLKKSTKKKVTAAMDAKQRAIQAHLDKIKHDEEIRAAAQEKALAEANAAAAESAAMQMAEKLASELGSLRIFADMEKNGAFLGPQVLSLLRGETLLHQQQHANDPISPKGMVSSAGSAAGSKVGSVADTPKAGAGVAATAAAAAAAVVPTADTAATATDGATDGAATAATAIEQTEEQPQPSTIAQPTTDPMRELVEKQKEQREAAAKEMAELTMHEYSFTLGKLGARVSSNFVDRIQNPVGTDITNEVLPYQLFVMDVYIQLPKAAAPSVPYRKGSTAISRAPSSRGSTPGAGADRGQAPDEGNVDLFASVASGQIVRTASSEDAPAPTLASARSKLPLQPLPVDIHHVIGCFDCSADKAPPYVETGLFDWSFFYEMYLAKSEQQQLQQASERATTAGGSTGSAATIGSSTSFTAAAPAEQLSATQQATINRQLERDRSWSPAHAQTGIAAIKVANGMHPTDATKDWQLLVMDKAAKSDYLIGQLPKKVQNWLGVTALLEEDA
jgi:hypothetical protein